MEKPVKKHQEIALTITDLAYGGARLARIDDFIIFAIAAFAINSSLGDKYGKYSKLIGGLILAALGIVLLFFPQLLH